MADSATLAASGLVGFAVKEATALVAELTWEVALASGVESDDGMTIGALEPEGDSDAVVPRIAA